MSAFEYPHAAERRQAPAHQQNAKRNRILIVEDNPISLTLLKQLLKAHGYEVLGTPEGLQALDLARAEQPDSSMSPTSGRARSWNAATRSGSGSPTISKRKRGSARSQSTSSKT
jgi:hypothetical protein